MSHEVKDMPLENATSPESKTSVSCKAPCVENALDEAQLLLQTQSVLQNAQDADAAIQVEDTVCEEVAANFAALLKDVDFTQELRIFNMGFFNRTLRRSLQQELTMVYIGLWALALEQSFPKTAHSFFTYFVEHHVEKLTGAAQKVAYEKIVAYREMILRSDAKDFNHISEHLLSFTKVKEEKRKADTLRLSLALRNHYTFIFQRLV